MKTVAAISFRDNHSLSMDVEAVNRIDITHPLQLEDGVWSCELLVRSSNGTVALQLLANKPEALQVLVQE